MVLLLNPEGMKRQDRDIIKRESRDGWRSQLLQVQDMSVSVSGLLETGEMLELEWQRVAVDASAGVEPSLITFFDRNDCDATVGIILRRSIN